MSSGRITKSANATTLAGTYSSRSTLSCDLSHHPPAPEMRHNNTFDSGIARIAARAGGKVFPRRRTMKMTHSLAIAWLAASVGILASAQEQDSARGGRGPAQTWWVNKTAGGVYKPPMRPLWKLSDLKQMHAGQNTWQEQIILDPEQDATYNSGAPGTKYTARMHPDSPAEFVVIAGQLHFNVEGQEPAAATRGAIVNIMKSTVFSYD